MSARNGLLIAAFLLCACDASGPVETLPADERPDLPIAPALIEPGEVADPTDPPSYEVAIASAAADRNKAVARCAAQSELVRVRCEQEANAAFVEARDDLQDLRGNQQ